MCEFYCVLFDGMLWVNEEMIDYGFSNKLGIDMGYMLVNGKGGVIVLLNEFNVECKVFIYINNINCVFDEDFSVYYSLCE